MSYLDQLHGQSQRALRDTTGETVRKVLAHYAQGHIERSAFARDAYASAVSQVINGGQQQAATNAAAYIAALAPPVRAVDLATALDDRLTTPESGNVLAGLLRLWHLEDEGLDPGDALAQAGDLAASLASTSLQGAMRDALDESVAAAEVEPRWRLEAAPGSCEWCQFIADTGSRYLAAESVPVPHSPGGPHPGGVCNCAPAPDFEGAFEGEGEGGIPLDEEGWPIIEGGADIPWDTVPQRDVQFLFRAREIYGERFVIESWGTDVAINVRDLSRMPDSVHRMLADHFAAGPDTAGIYLGTGSVPDLDHLERLRDLHPRGWPAGSTWREVSGAYAPRERAVVIGTGEHGSNSLALHEVGHGIDAALRTASYRDAFLDVYDDVKRAAFDADFIIRPYYTQLGSAGPSEMFAEAFGRYMVGDIPGVSTRLGRLRDLVGSRTGAQALIDYFDGLLPS